MVCKKCEVKLRALSHPEPWRDGSRSTQAGSSGRKTGENKLLSKGNKKKFAPYERTCKSCKVVHQEGANYCQGCAYKTGICAMCGVKILDTTNYRQSNV
ncbi:hypothetical protein M427DRAFT_100496 [Gonapodya prolifera JEL478]|uniref:Cysteine-rich PDZ-binding protein n=1 Tax=Gonapodya prolifera (strain JEL478) TaxID=1344416 RepID=A0A139A9H5_GONPJ|nr:hypothetical protein M427DRAFT_100496 [Gonapodya prolifera JEL478]|eukprot:KXS13481.1 hypothetical protein M427DRAFT_100496 [Gonapodya prolifera JEL478]